jgi:hypothetical protein
MHTLKIKAIAFKNFKKEKKLNYSKLVSML